MLFFIVILIKPPGFTSHGVSMLYYNYSKRVTQLVKKYLGTPEYPYVNTLSVNL